MLRKRVPQLPTCEGLPCADERAVAPSPRLASSVSNPGDGIGSIASPTERFWPPLHDHNIYVDIFLIQEQSTIDMIQPVIRKGIEAIFCKPMPSFS